MLVLPIPGLFTSLANIPWVVALIGIVLQVLRDDARHQRRLDLLFRQHDFDLGIASHMARVAYDKHASFSESYISCVYEAFLGRVGSGPSPEAGDLASKLARIRLTYAAWLSTEIEAGLHPFENALQQIADGKRRLEDLPASERRDAIVEKVYRFYGLVTGLEKPNSEADARIAHDAVLNHLRDLLGIPELTLLRHTLLKRALARFRQEAKEETSR